MALTPVASAAVVVERGVVAGEAGAAAREPARHEAWPPTGGEVICWNVRAPVYPIGDSPCTQTNRGPRGACKVTLSIG
jgi:hypothetical protein